MSLQQAPNTIRYLRHTVLAFYYMLLVFFVVSAMTMTVRTGITTLVIWTIQVFPLLIFLYPLHRNQLRAYAWLSFVVLIYFVHGVLTAFDEDRFLLGLVEVALCSLVFISLIAYIRTYRNHYKVPI